jgi:hypothetical protein
MIECIFTIDYEIYGNGKGSLRQLVYEPARKLKELLDRTGMKAVMFVEAAELEKIEASGADPAIGEVKQQLRELYKERHEIALHIHPQWCDASYHNGKWCLNYSEYNLCTLPKKRIAEIVDGSIAYLRTMLAVPDFTPLSFRAGGWLLQPSRNAADILIERGVKIDSSVFRGGIRRWHKLDYRRAAKNEYFWKFRDDANVPDQNGSLLEIPIYTRMVPFWELVTLKRFILQQKGFSGAQTIKQKLCRFQDIARFRYPMKFDFCRMTVNELVRMVDTVIEEDQRDPSSFKPLVAIGHTKDLADLKAVESLLYYLEKKGIAISTFEEIYHKYKLWK